MSDVRFLFALILAAIAMRLCILGVLLATDAVETMRLSPDSLAYHLSGLSIAAEMARGTFNWTEWIDGGYFQFTGFVYWIFGPKQWLMQVINIIVGSVTIVPLYAIMKRCIDDAVTQRLYCVLVAFFPSLVWWSVLHLKDAISTFGMIIVVYAIFMFRIRPRWGVVAAYVVGMLLLLLTRSYLFFVSALLTAPALLVFPFRPSQHAFRIFVIAVVAGVLPMFFGYGYYGVSSIAESRYFDIDYINRVRVSMGTHGSGRIFAGDVHVWGQSFWGDVVAVAKTLFSVFVPVNPFAIGSVRQAMALPLVFAMILLFIPMAKGFPYAWRIRVLSAPVGLMTAAFLAVYISGTTNVGALFRWTTQIMPFLLMLVAIGVAGKRSALLYGVAKRILPPPRENG